MLFTVIIPTFNAKNSIRKCIDSVLSQTFREFEIVIIDDGSCDGTEKILDTYAENDERIKVFHIPNSGVSAARRTGILEAKGEYVLFVDSDDTIEPKLLEKIDITIMNSNKPDIIRYQSNLLGDESHKDHDRYNFSTNNTQKIYSGMEALRAWSIPDKKYAVYWLYAFKKTIFSNITYFPNLRCYEDVALIPILIAKASTIVTINYIGYNYTCNNIYSLTNTQSYSAERARAIDFVLAYKYVIKYFHEIEGITPSDSNFFTNDFNRRLKGKFESLNESLKNELAYLFEIN